MVSAQADRSLYYRYTTPPHCHRENPNFIGARNGRHLFCFFMWSVFAAMPTELFKFQTVLESLFVLSGKIVDLFTLRALQFDEVILRHKLAVLLSLLVNSKLFVGGAENRI